jgi:hypothetical protein
LLSALAGTPFAGTAFMRARFVRAAQYLSLGEEPVLAVASMWPSIPLVEFIGAAADLFFRPMRGLGHRQSRCGRYVVY